MLKLIIFVIYVRFRRGMSYLTVGISIAMLVDHFGTFVLLAWSSHSALHPLGPSTGGLHSWLENGLIEDVSPISLLNMGIFQPAMF